MGQWNKPVVSQTSKNAPHSIRNQNVPLDLRALMRLQCPHMAATEAEFLLIDNSNSFTKFAISTRKEISAPRRLSTPAVEKDSLVRILHGWKFQSVIASRPGAMTPPTYFLSFEITSKLTAVPKSTATAGAP